MKVEEMRPADGYLIVQIHDLTKGSVTLVEANIVRTDNPDRDEFLSNWGVLIPLEDGGDHFYEQAVDGQEKHYALIRESVIRVFHAVKPEKKR
jgi:hypothetical protein